MKNKTEIILEYKNDIGCVFIIKLINRSVYYNINNVYKEYLEQFEDGKYCIWGDEAETLAWGKYNDHGYSYPVCLLIFTEIIQNGFSKRAEELLTMFDTIENNL